MPELQGSPGIAGDIGPMELGRSQYGIRGGAEVFLPVGAAGSTWSWEPALAVEPTEPDTAVSNLSGKHGPAGAAFVPDLAQTTEPKRLPGPLQFVVKLLEFWRLEEEDAVRLLGFAREDADYVASALAGGGTVPWTRCPGTDRPSVLDSEDPVRVVSRSGHRECMAPGTPFLARRQGADGFAARRIHGRPAAGAGLCGYGRGCIGVLQSIPSRSRSRQVYRLARDRPTEEILAEHQLDPSAGDDIAADLVEFGYVVDERELLDTPFRPKRKRKPTRFSDGSFPVFYSSLSSETAEAEVRHWAPTVMGRPRQPRTTYYWLFRCTFEGVEKDLRPQIQTWPDLVHDDDYTLCNRLGAEAVELGPGWPRDVVGPATAGDESAGVLAPLASGARNGGADGPNLRSGYWLRVVTASLVPPSVTKKARRLVPVGGAVSGRAICIKPAKAALLREPGAASLHVRSPPAGWREVRPSPLGDRRAAQRPLR